MIEGFQLSPQQKHLWQRLQPHTGMPARAVFSVELKADTKLDAFRAAFEKSCGLHEALHLQFHRLPGMNAPVQAPGEFEIRWLPTETLPKEGWQALHQSHLLEREQGHDAPSGQFFKSDDESHLFVFSASSLCADHGSFLHLLNQASSLYEQKPFATEELPQYIDIAEWLNELLDSPEAASGREYWAKLRDKQREHAFQWPYRKDANLTFTPALTAAIDIPAGLVQVLHQTAQAWDTNPAALIFGIWQGMLSRYTEDRRITSLVSFDGRLDQELKQVVGPLARHVPLLVDYDPRQSLKDFHYKVTQTLKDAFAWQECYASDTFASDEEDANPLAGFEYMDTSSLEDMAMLGSIQGTHLQNLLDLQLVCFANQRTIRCHIVFNRAVVTRENAETMGPQLLKGLQFLFSHPHAACGQLDFWSGHQTLALTNQLRGARTELPEQSLIELLEAQAETNPTAPALTQDSTTLTFAELLKASNKLAGTLLQASGKSAWQPYRVALFMPRQLEAIVAMIAALKAGATYVPLDTNAPSSRTTHILKDATPSLILTTRAMVEKLPESVEATVMLVDDLPPLAQTPELPKPHSGRAAYMIYTSGTTGRPKGTIISLKALTEHASVMVNAFDLRAGDRMLAFASFAFDAVLDQIFPPLLAGATVILKPDELWDASHFDEHVREARLTHVNVPTPFWHTWSQARKDAKSLPPSLKVVIAGGDVMLAEATQTWFRVEGKASETRPFRLINAYGPTETTVTALIHSLDKAVAANQPSVPIGRALPNRETWICNPQGQLVPAGVPGELYLGGISLSQGYLGLPGLTAATFLPDHLGDTPGARLYRTGDRVQLDHAGCMTFLGRADHQVKIRGFRVELHSIESHLRAHESIDEAVVLAVPDPANPAQKTLAAYITTCAQKTVPQDAALVALLKTELPDYMVPTYFMHLPSLPKLTSGKVDRRALPEPQLQKQNLDKQAISQASHVQLLAQIWASLLGHDQFEIHSNFFEIGGHSLNAMQLVSRIRNAFGIHITLQSLFANPRMNQQVALIETGFQNQEQLAPPPPLDKVSRDKTLPLSFAQHRLWIACKLDPENSAYHMPATIALNGQFHLEHFEKAMTAVLSRHENLRVRFEVVQDEPVQRFHPVQPFQVHRQQAASGLNTTEQEQVTLWRHSVSAKPFDLEKDLLIRCHILEFSEKKRYLHINLHHIISDGWSISILIREVLALYQGLLDKRQTQLTELAIQYADYAAWQHVWLNEETKKQHLDFWRDYLAGAPSPQPLPYDHSPSPDAATHAAAAESFQLSRDTTQWLKDFTVKHQVTPFMVLLNTFNCVIHHMTGGRDLVIGSDVANRNHPEEEHLIGFFINQTMFRAHMRSQATLLEHLETIRRDAFSLLAYQAFPFDQIVTDLNPPRSKELSPFFQAKLVYQNAPVSQISLPELECEQLAQEVSATKLNLQFNLWEKAGQIHGLLKYKRASFQKSTVQSLNRLFGWAMEETLQQPDMALQQLCEALSKREAEIRKAGLSALKSKGFKKFKPIKTR